MIAIALLLAALGIAALAYMPRIESYVLAAVPEPAGPEVPPLAYIGIVIVAAVVVTAVLYGVARAREEG